VGRGEEAGVAAARDEFLGHYRKLGRSPHSELRLAHQTALWHLGAGRFAEAAAVIRQVEETEPPSFFTVGWGAYLSGELARARGRAGEAQEAYRDAITYAERAEVRSTAMRTRALVGLAEALCDAKPGVLRLRRAEGGATATLRPALEAAELALKLALEPETRNELEEVRARRALGRASAAAGDLRKARACMEAALAAAAVLENPLERAHGLVALAELERVRDDQEATQQRLREAAEIYRALGNEHRAREATRAAETTSEARETTSPRIVLPPAGAGPPPRSEDDAPTFVRKGDDSAESDADADVIESPSSLEELAPSGVIEDVEADEE
jgi:tetratricopeptide (TPR) repeat protein